MEAAVIDKEHQTPLGDTKMTSPGISKRDATVSPQKSITGRTCFSRPKPRLDGHGRIRKNSVQGSGASASESEDDVRRNSTTIPTVNLTKPEAAVQSEKPTVVTNSSINLSNTVVKAKRKMVISESARKLAEARREFQLKHENKPPDRSQLRMYDFIHYNPTTNPMKKKPSNTNTTQSTVRAPVEPRVTIPVEENADDPAPTAMPVPQVKVGPDGQLVLDEQSLVIENTGVKESREVIANQAVIFEDNDFGNGFYKRRKKTKEWPEWETIKFYKALNIVGTDFLLMQSLFTKRSRQELKVKFKKEERMNRLLVEKALKYSQEFDIDLLKKELESFENPEKVVPKSSSKVNSTKNAPKQSRKRKQASRRIAAMSICEEDGDEEVSTEYEEVDEPPKKMERVNIKTSELGDCDEADNESDTEIYEVKPTRSGRRPKVRNIRTNVNHTLTKIFENDSERTDDTSQTEVTAENSKEQVPITQEASTLEDNNPEPDFSSVVPGSLVIVCKESANQPGENVVQVYMVGPDGTDDKMNITKTVTPIDVRPEALSMLTNETSSDTAVNIVEQ
ncbi:hypothetical protein PV328_002260 [Microctonus aethiopoides]|uniref:Myb-like domain-containing protein n=1 Tax=Microctonus aethiopoides TaxID=144406 RepID=A0AA39FZ56_9HYME|nr:hypothetical protein PV328_002260 [Microctonus aethiopoides]